MQNINLLLYLIFAAAPLSTMIHELGHAAAARLLRVDDVSLSIGSGKEIGSLEAAGIRINIHVCYFLGGVVQSVGNNTLKGREKVLISLAGPLASAFSAFLAFLAMTGSNEYLHLFALFNLWLAAVNILPFKFRGKETDGYIIWTTIAKHRALSKFRHK
ncbi:site-2 protease family protein [Virgibacillus sediminis]|uniref:Site-2 protease family protein n=1 Tax=Virgibacillus sediminis TaxID=202260 RepID=A0ABV7A5I5_9BACI